MSVTEAKMFVDNWSKAWRDHDGHAYAAMLHDDCVLRNPIATTTREQLPQFVESLLQVWQNHSIRATHWAHQGDDILIEWVATGRLPKGEIELRGTDRFTMREGKVSDGVSYFDPRRFLELT
jgi:ketosteroid isomerase-like protein